MTIPQTQYSPMHWLAYHNDWMSLKYLLSLCLDLQDPDYELKMVRKCMRSNTDDMTPLDIAGKNGCIRTAIVIINYFKEMFGVLAEEFTSGSETFSPDGKMIKDADGNRINYMEVPKLEETDNFKIKYVSHKQLTKFQKRVTDILYWGGFFGDLQLVTLYLKYLGVSPFLKIETGKNLVSACVEGQQFDLLKLLIEDSQINEEGCSLKYDLKGLPEADKTYWKNSRESKDAYGNNTCHFALAIQNNEEREKYVKLLLDNEVGDIDKPNKRGIEPIMIEHSQPLRIDGKG